MRRERQRSSKGKLCCEGRQEEGLGRGPVWGGHTGKPIHRVVGI